jgi:hypothetical protein
MTQRQPLSAPQPLMVRKDTRPVVHKEFLRLIGAGISPIARFGDWFAFRILDAKQSQERIVFHNPFQVDASCQLTGDLTRPCPIVVLNLRNEDSPQHAVTVNLTTVQVWKQLQRAVTIPLPACDARSQLVKAVRLNDTHVIGTRMLRVNKVLSMFHGNYEMALFSANIETKNVVEHKVQGALDIVPLPSNDEKKQNRFAVATFEDIDVYELKETKKNIKSAEQFNRLYSIECMQGGSLSPSLSGNYWVTSAIEWKAVGDKPAELINPAKLWRLDDGHPLKEIVSLPKNAIGGWFAEHFLYSNSSSILHAVHPETFVSYVIRECWYQQYGNRMLMNGKTGAEILSEENLDDALTQSIAGAAQLPLTVSGIVCQFLIGHMQRFFPQKVFEPLVSDRLPQKLHPASRKLQWELWSEGHDSALNVMQAALSELPKLKEFELHQCDSRIKKFFDAVAKEMVAEQACDLPNRISSL